MARIKVEGIDYSPEGIEQVRQKLIFHRDEAIKAFPEGIEAAVFMSHIIALIADYKEMREAEDAEWICPQCNMPGEPKFLGEVDGVRLLECPRCYHQFELTVENIDPAPGEHTASWIRSDTGGSVRVTARWKDEEEFHPSERADSYGDAE